MSPYGAYAAGVLRLHASPSSCNAAALPRCRTRPLIGTDRRPPRPERPSWAGHRQGVGDGRAGGGAAPGGAAGAGAARGGAARGPKSVDPESGGTTEDGTAEDGTAVGGTAVGGTAVGGVAAGAAGGLTHIAFTQSLSPLQSRSRPQPPASERTCARAFCSVSRSTRSSARWMIWLRPISSTRAASRSFALAQLEVTMKP